MVSARAEIKECSGCNLIKPLEDFHKQITKKDGKRSRCKACEHSYYERVKERVALYNKKYIIVNRIRNNERIRNWTRNNPNRRLLVNAKIRAKRKGLEFNLKLEDIIIPTICPVLGISLLQAEKFHNDNSPTIDRIDNTLGYTKDNIAIISWKANRLKNNGTLEELKNLVSWLQKTKDERSNNING